MNWISAKEKLPSVPAVYLVVLTGKSGMKCSKCSFSDGKFTTEDEIVYWLEESK